MANITQARKLNSSYGGGVRFKEMSCACTKGLVNSFLKGFQSERYPHFLGPDQSIVGMFSPFSPMWKGHKMADLRRQGTCLCGFSDMLINWSPEMVCDGHMRHPLATQWTESSSPLNITPFCLIFTPFHLYTGSEFESRYGWDVL